MSENWMTFSSEKFSRLDLTFLGSTFEDPEMLNIYLKAFLFLIPEQEAPFPAVWQILPIVTHCAAPMTLSCILEP